MSPLVLSPILGHFAITCCLPPGEDQDHSAVAGQRYAYKRKAPRDHVANGFPI
ncbi:MAG TPA: hypothetical protein VHC19_08645 [Pirellulales bacterium]|nr:hypothetical protein [Pirellulales bacterium]